MLHDIAVWAGLTNGSGRWYLFWSGIGSDLVYLGVLVGIFHHLNCHEYHCWRVGRHPHTMADGTHVKVCKHHHPTGGHRDIAGT